MPGLDRPPYDLLPLGEEQPPLRFEVQPQLDVAQADIVTQTWIGGIL